MIKNFVGCEKGAVAIEYGLIAVLIASVLVTALTSIGSNQTVTLDNVASKF